LQIIEKVTHPNYDPSRKDNNIGLVKLENKIEFTDYRRPACLYTNQEVLPAEMVATGWGKTENGTLSKDLLKVTLVEVPIDECKKKYNSLRSPSLPYALNLTYKFCAGERKTRADPCKVGTWYLHLY